MLKQLFVRNFALITEATIRFEDSFTAITGETGSGKSILLGALNLILGERADYSTIRNKEEKTIVEANFTLKKDCANWFEENDIDFDFDTVVRREITSNGKSRAFINDTPVSLAQLAELGEKLVYIHSQHETLALRRQEFQFSLIDSFGNLSEESNKLRLKILALKELEKEINELKKVSETASKERDFIQFQANELEKLELSKHDFVSYENEFIRYTKLEDLTLAYANVISCFEGDNALESQLVSFISYLEKNKTLSSEFVSYTQRAKSVLIELQDLSSEVSQNAASLQSDPERVQFLQFWLDKFNHVRHKYGLESSLELSELHSQFLEQLESFDSSAEKMESLEISRKLLFEEIQKLRNNLFDKRKLSGRALATHLISILKDLKLQDTVLDFEIALSDGLDSQGGMSVKMMFSANKGLETKPIEKTASGGELSRLMLAVQSTMSDKTQLPTLILDEIDTGVSGEVALRIAQLLQQMGKKMQVLAITHLPQVASKAIHQLEVQKQTLNSQTETYILNLTQEDRIVAIAKLMAGENVTESSRQSAKELMFNN
jgi:DNA repair protein RecN (Recombination protein N)